MYFIILTASQ